jgi:serine/threonine-protein kinase
MTAGTDLGGLRDFLRGESEDAPGPDAPVGEIALSRGWLTEAQLEEALEEQRRSDPRPLIGQILLRRKALTAEQLLRALASQRRPAAPPPLPEGARIGPYVLRREIGRGGMGVVYEAEDPAAARRVAVKVIREDGSDPSALERLRREAEIVARLSHPGIVAVRDVGTTKSFLGPARPYLVMDYVEGRTLQDILAEGATPRAEILRILEEVSRAAAHAHAHGVVHRDLKPTNVLVDRAGRALLTDFGVARTSDSTTGLTPSDAVVGTLGYFAPEQVLDPGSRPGPPADVYALGVMLYVALAGRLPYAAASPAALLKHMLWGQPAPIAPCPGPDLEAVVRKAMEQRPGWRYPSAGEFADELALVRQGKPVMARQTGSVAGIWQRPPPTP